MAIVKGNNRMNRSIAGRISRRFPVFRGALLLVALLDAPRMVAGNAHTLGREGGGRVVAWGNNNYGQTNVPGGLSTVTAIPAGHRHSLALKSDGTVVAWGDNLYGQTDVPSGLSD